MGDKFLAVWRVLDSKDKVLDFVEAHSEFSAILVAVKRGHLATQAEIHRIINL